MALQKPTPVSSLDDVRRFFDAFAPRNHEQHGRPDALLNYRVNLLRAHSQLRSTDDVLDLGCGNGHHLFALDGSMRSATGIDLAPQMVAAAERAQPVSPRTSYRFLVDDAQRLTKVPDQSVDVAWCVGALEHMFDKAAVLSAARRVLRTNGRFVCLTLNDQFVWYSKLAPRLGYTTQHLSSDRRLDSDEACHLMHSAGFREISVSYWRFIPRGDMPPAVAHACRLLDAVGNVACARYLRGGLVVRGVV